MPARVTLPGDAAMWHEIVAPTEPLGDLLRWRSTETGTRLVLERYPNLDYGRTRQTVQLARQKHSAGRTREAARIICELEALGERHVDRVQRPVRPWLYRAGVAAASGAILFGGWVIR